MIAGTYTRKWNSSTTDANTPTNAYSDNDSWYEGTSVVVWTGELDTCREYRVVASGSTRERQHALPEPMPHKRSGWPYQSPPPFIWAAPEPARIVQQCVMRVRARRQHRDSFRGRAGTLRRWKAKQGV